MNQRNLLLASTSTIHGGTYLGYLQDLIAEHFSECHRVVFVPFARPGGISHDDYTALVAGVFEKLGITVRGLHTFESIASAMEWADGFFTGGGNTFVLLRDLYEKGAIEPLRQAIASGKPYMGTSAGSNIAGRTVGTTNDMPIVYPPSFDALGYVPFNLNPHYLDPDPSSKHMGETRETRIREFHKFNAQPVVGLREGSALLVNGDQLKLWGEHTARIFEAGKEAYELDTNSDFNFLLTAH